MLSGRQLNTPHTWFHTRVRVRFETYVVHHVVPRSAVPHTLYPHHCDCIISRTVGLEGDGVTARGCNSQLTFFCGTLQTPLLWPHKKQYTRLVLALTYAHGA